jgi:hypothetical protein
LLEGIANTGGVAESGGNKYFEVFGIKNRRRWPAGLNSMLGIADVEVIGDVLAIGING